MTTTISQSASMVWSIVNEEKPETTEAQFLLDDSSRALLQIFPRVPRFPKKRELATSKSRTPTLPVLRSRGHLEEVPICPFLKLPQEIIQHIAAILPRPTAAVLTFACKPIYAALNKGYWEPYRYCLHKRKVLLDHWYWKCPLGMRLEDPTQLIQSPHSLSSLIAFSWTGSEEEGLLGQCNFEGCRCRTEWIMNEKLLKGRRQVLELVGRDIPDMIRCGRCITLHRPGRRTPAKDSSDLRECELQDAHYGVGKVVYEGFTFPHLQHAMKISRNKDCDRKFLRSLNQSQTFHDSELTQVHHTSTKCRIVGESFLVRTQHWILFLSPSATSATTDPTSTLHGPNSTICGHLVFGDSDLNHLLHIQGAQQSRARKSLDEVFRCRRRHLPSKATGTVSKAGFDLCTGIQQCRYCETEFVIDTKPFNHGARGTAIILTKWLSLGRGEMCGDPQWRRHFTTSSSHNPQPRSCASTSIGTKAHDIQCPEIITWPKGSIRDAFERGRPFEFEKALSERRERELWALVEEVAKLRVLQCGLRNLSSEGDKPSAAYKRERDGWAWGRKSAREKEVRRKAEEEWASFGTG